MTRTRPVSFLIFLLTRPSRGATRYCQIFALKVGDFYSHAPRGAQPKPKSVISISMSFLLTRPSRGATLCRSDNSLNLSHFYSHAPRGAQLNPSCKACISVLFLLTRPSRGATSSIISSCKTKSISTHTPLAGRNLPIVYDDTLSYYISTHTPLAGRNISTITACKWIARFLLTRPSRGATAIKGGFV